MQNNSSPPAELQQKVTKPLTEQNKVQQPQAGKDQPTNNNNNNNTNPPITGSSQSNNKNNNNNGRGEPQPRHPSHHHVIGHVINNLRTVLGHPPPPPQERHRSADNNSEKKTTPPNKSNLHSPSPASRISTPSKTPNQQELVAVKSHETSRHEEMSLEAGSFSMNEGKPGLALTLPPAKSSGNVMAQNAKAFELAGYNNTNNNNNVDNNNIRIELTAASASATHPVQAQEKNADNLSVKQVGSTPAAASSNLANTHDVPADKDVSTSAGKVGKTFNHNTNSSSLNKAERAHSGAVDTKTGALLEPNNTAFDDISLVPHDYNGRFKAVTKLGSGTFGQVFLCAFILSATTPRTTNNNNNSSARYNYSNVSCTNNSIPHRNLSGAVSGDDTRFTAGSPLGNGAAFPKLLPNANSLKRTPSSGAVHGYTKLIQRGNDSTKNNNGDIPSLHASPIEAIRRSGNRGAQEPAPRRSPPGQSGDDQELTRSPHQPHTDSEPHRTHNESGGSINSSGANGTSSRRIAQEAALRSEKNGSRISSSIPLLIDNPAGDVSSLAATRPVINIHGVNYKREQIFVCKMEVLPDKIKEQEDQLRQVSSRVFGKPLTYVALPHLPSQGFVVGVHSGVEALGKSSTQNNNLESGPNSCRDFPLEIDSQPAENSTKRYVISRYAEETDSASSSGGDSPALGSDADVDAHPTRRTRAQSQQRRRRHQSRANSMNEGSSRTSRGSAISEGTRISILSGLAHATRMTRESHLLSNLAHPNIVSYIDCFRRENTQYLFLEYVDGGDLERELEIRRVGRQYLSEESVLFLFVQVCLAIEYLHRNNILHRDIKLANILKSKNFICKLSDFGTAEKFDVDTYNLVDEKLRGTPSFLAPELWIGAPYSEKADIYSLGVVLYALLDPFGLPYNAQTIPALREQVLKSAPRPLTRPVSPGVAVILRALLRKDPTRRPSVLEILTSETMQKPLDSYRNKMAELVRSTNATKVDQNWLAVLEDHIAIVRGKELPSFDRGPNRTRKNDNNGATQNQQAIKGGKRGASPGGNDDGGDRTKHENSLFLIKNQLPDGTTNLHESSCGDDQRQPQHRSRRNTNKMESNAAPTGPERAGSDSSRCSRTSQASRREYERSRLSEVRSRGASGQSRRSAASSEHRQSQRAMRATGILTHESNDDSDGDVLVKMLQQQKQTNQNKK